MGMSPGYVENAERVAQEAVQEVVADLRRLADQVDRIHFTDSLRDLQPDYAGFIAEVIHKVHWGLANMDLDGLARRGAEAHAAVRAEF